MSEWSKGTHTERMSKGEQRRIRGVQLVCSFLMERHTQEPFPAMSDHYQEPTELAEVIAIQPTLWDDLPPAA